MFSSAANTANIPGYVIGGALLAMHSPRTNIVGTGIAGLLFDRARRMPLGLDDDIARPAEQRLEPGDRTLFYTDGDTEARRTKPTVGLDRLVQLAETTA